jgi:dihydrofolate synthase/folylpolyglutamate synthase
VAQEKGVEIVDADLRLVANAVMCHGQATITVVTPHARYENVPLGLNGRHQIANAVVAIRVLELLDEAEMPLTSADIVAGLTQVVWPARLEWVQLADDRRLLIDAAHNVAGAQAMAEYLTDSGCAPCPLVLAVMRDKDVAGIVAALSPVASRFIVTSVALPRAMTAPALADEVRRIAPHVPVEIVDEPLRATQAALVACKRAGAAGSIFFVGPLRERLLGNGALSLQSS